LNQEHCAASWDNINYYYDFGKMIGHGSFGTVRIATRREEERKVPGSLKIQKKSGGSGGESPANASFGQALAGSTS
jgi:hypothetical protein